MVSTGTLFRVFDEFYNNCTPSGQGTSQRVSSCAWERNKGSSKDLDSETLSPAQHVKAPHFGDCFLSSTEAQKDVK
jgi:hypothetical protein